jgi:hypothetical protein
LGGGKRERRGSEGKQSSDGCCKKYLTVPFNMKFFALSNLGRSIIE